MSVRALLFLAVWLWGTRPLSEKLALRGASPVIVLLLQTPCLAAWVAGAAAATGQIGQVVRMEGWSRWS